LRDAELQKPVAPHVILKQKICGRKTDGKQFKEIEE